MIFGYIIGVCTPWALISQDCWGLPDKNPKELYILFEVIDDLGFPGALVSKESACRSLNPRLERSSGGGNYNPLPYSFLGNPMDRAAGRVLVHAVAKESDTTDEAEFYLLGLYAICVSILMKCWFTYLAHFNWVVFLL